MRINPIIILITFSFLCPSVSLAQSSRKLSGKPETLEETYKYLGQMFDDTAKYGFMKMPAAYAASSLHFGLGLWIRNNWGLWKGGKLNSYFTSRGISHPDHMSNIILLSYHRYLNYQSPYDIRDGKITDTSNSRQPAQEDTSAYTLHSFSGGLNNTTGQDTLMKYFPVGDTILTTVLATSKKLLKTQVAGARTVVLVKEHRDNILVVQILSINARPKEKVEHKAGDIIETRVFHCWPLPPPDWKPREDAGNAK